MENYYYIVIGNSGENGEQVGAGYKTPGEVKARIKELGNTYDSYGVLKVNADDESDVEIVEI